jgi:hypothetical protein
MKKPDYNKHEQFMAQLLLLLLFILFVVCLLFAIAQLAGFTLRGTI